MDPLGSASPDACGFVTVGVNVRLHYRIFRPNSAKPGISGGGSGRHPLLLLMGAFATQGHFAELARHIADQSGHEVATYDHRGVGRSGPPVLAAQTAAQLAADALVVADTLWGAGTALHVYGWVRGWLPAGAKRAIVEPPGAPAGHAPLSCNPAVPLR
jgi:alpha-beta hydrolase superfamily lysophospholipase